MASTRRHGLACRARLLFSSCLLLLALSFSPRPFHVCALRLRGEIGPIPVPMAPGAGMNITPKPASMTVPASRSAGPAAAVPVRPAAESSKPVPPAAPIAVPKPAELEAALAALPPPPKIAATGVALKSATDTIHSLETDQEKRQELISEMENDMEEEEEDADAAAEDDAHLQPLITPAEAARIAAEVALHEANPAAHVSVDGLPPHEHEEARKEHQAHEQSTHEMHAVAVHDGKHETSEEHPAPAPLPEPKDNAVGPDGLPVNIPVPAALASPTSPHSSTPSDLRARQRTLLRRMAAARVAKAQRAVRQALHEKVRFKQTGGDAAGGGKEAPIDLNYDSTVAQPDLFSIDHSHDDELDDDLGRDKLLLKYAMDQMAAESRKKQDEIAQLLQALKVEHIAHEHLSKHVDVESDPIQKQLREMQQEILQHSAAVGVEPSSPNYTLWILLSIGLLCLCIAVPVVWIYWLRTWLLTSVAVGGRQQVQYRSINAAAGEVVTATIPEEAEEDLEEDELPVDSPASRIASTPAAVRFDPRASKKAQAGKSANRTRHGVVVASASAHRSSPRRSPPSRAARDLPDFADYSSSAARLPPGPKPRVEDLPEDEEDFEEESDMITASRSGR